MNTSDFLLSRLREWGVKRVFGYPGDGINGIAGAFSRAEDDDGGVEFIQVRHEEMAALMATAHAKFTGEIGVCLATSGPGAIHLLNGLYDAKMDKTPVVAIVGQSSTLALGGDYQQEVDLQQLFEDVSEYVATVASPPAIRHVVDRAFRIAQGMRGVCTIIVPKDIQEQDYADPPRKHNTLRSSVGYSRPIVVPASQDLQRAADVLNAGERVAMLVGAGALHASEEVLAVADLLGGCVAKALLGKATLPDEIPWVTGTIGLLGTKQSAEMMNECDTLLMVGSAFPYAEFLPKEGQARGVQIDIDPRYLGIRFPSEVNLIGDSADTLRALIPFLRAKADRSWRESIIRVREAFEEDERARAHMDTDRLNPQRVFYELNEHLPDNCIVTADAGTAANWSARNLKMRRGMKYSLSGGLATMGSAVPYAIAAKFAYPDRVTIACTGDGAMQMNGNAELLTVMKYWKQWSDPRIIFLVLNNEDLNQVTWEMRVESGDAKYEASQNLPSFSYAAYAESIGMRGIRVEAAPHVEHAWSEAFESDRPVLIEAVVDPAVQQLPPHITLEQAHGLFSALVHGDPERAAVIKESIRSVLTGILPGRPR
ncbi:MAG: thiamine pyrophosphate-requiring protein [Candidatus Eremiobacteraeota bacterium]|nr:thiamine pyrophosphate-requiring protein [Candidatus Eremiobacteraeota bacterium]